LDRKGDKMKSFKKILAISAISFAITGCGYIKNSYVNDETLINKAAFALGEEPKNIKIIEKSPEIDSIRYTVKIKGKAKTKQCYFTTMLALDSDAVCSGSTNPLTQLR
jgi:predicted nucleic acid-binding protein